MCEFFRVPIPTWLNVSPLIYHIFFWLIILPKCVIRHNQTQCLRSSNFPSIIWHFDGFYFHLWQLAFLDMSPQHALPFSSKAYVGHWQWKLPGTLSGNGLMMGLSKAIGIIAPLPSSVVPNCWPTRHRWPTVRGFSIKRLPIMILLQYWNLGALDICLLIR